MMSKSIKFKESIMDLNYTRGGLLDKFDGIVPEKLPRIKKEKTDLTEYVYNPLSFQNYQQSGDRRLRLDKPENMEDYTPDITWASKVKFKKSSKEKEPIRTEKDSVGESTEGLNDSKILELIAAGTSKPITDEYVYKYDLNSDVVFLK